MCAKTAEKEPSVLCRVKTVMGTGWLPLCTLRSHIKVDGYLITGVAWLTRAGSTVIYPNSFGISEAQTMECSRKPLCTPFYPKALILSKAKQRQ